MSAFLRTCNQFLWFLSMLVAAPSVFVLGWHLVDPSRFVDGAPFGLTLGRLAAAAAVGTLAANAIAWLRPDDMAGWMAPAAGLLLLVFGGEMLLLSVSLP